MDLEDESSRRRERAPRRSDSAKILRLLTNTCSTALRIEWCKSRARAQHWQEECKLLTEKIHRVKVTFQFYNNVWNDRAMKVDLPGAKAYALKQATLWKELEENAGKQWESTIAAVLPVTHEVPDTMLDLDSHGHSSSLSS